MEYKSLDIVEIAGRGRVFIVEMDKDGVRNDLIGSEVTIDGQKYKVRGVEAFSIERIYEGQRIGLLV